MIKGAAVLTLAGLLLLMVSFMPWTPQAAKPQVIDEIPVMDIAERGRALFLAKGCTGCHQHDGALKSENPPLIGPDLTDYESEPAFVRSWLRNPAAVRPKTRMPNLNLDAAEIEALVAFLAE